MSLEALAETDRVALPAWVRLRFDPVRDRWVLLAPERVLFPCATSVEILDRLPAAPTLGALIDALAAEYEAPREAIAADVQAMLGDLAAQGFLGQPGAGEHV
jgi:pyrroloquinoline quinone biosynthesis protein D